ncbi:hypothetical protein V6216_22005, partial [Enterobacter hormaechei]|uniref:hypothetical protein n=1 Tax=Enterobacter hormaechei TaxID=158836 RepID=UPI003B88A737
ICHRQNMKTSIINGSEVSRLSVAIQNTIKEQPNVSGNAKIETINIITRSNYYSFFQESDRNH